VRRPDLLVPVAPHPPVETAPQRRRRRLAVVGTLVVGTALLAATLRVPRGSAAFTILGVLVACAWISGALASGPIPIQPRDAAPRRVVLGAATIGVVAFLGFLGAYLVAEHLPVLSDALDTVLGKADAGPLVLILVIALLNAVAEELFFRGALHAALEPHRPGLVATVVYVAVTATTGNLALVVAAAVMGTVFSLERLATRSLLASLTTHVVWSTLILLALPR
jgi:membrane protease YdiL (CAAX protease family)